MRQRSTRITWAAMFAGWAFMTAAFLTVPVLRQVLPIDGEAAPRVSRILLATDLSERIDLIESLPETLGDRATAELADVAVGAEDLATRLAAVSALSRVPGGVAVLAGLGLRDEMRPAVLAALARAKGSRAVAALIDLLPACRDADDRAAAYVALARHGGARAVEKLAQVASDRGLSARERSLAADALSELRDPADAVALASHLRPGNEDALNERILRVLARLGDPRASSAVARFLEESRSESSRLAAIATLERLGDAYALRALAAARDRAVSPAERHAARAAIDAVRRRRLYPPISRDFPPTPR